MVVSNLKALALHLLSSFSVLSMIITAIVVVIVIRCWLDECCLCWNCHEILLKNLFIGEERSPGLGRGWGKKGERNRHENRTRGEVEMNHSGGSGIGGKL